MKYDLLTVPESEQHLLFLPKPDTTAHQTKVGCVRGDFGKSGDEFHHTWFPHREDLNTDEFIMYESNGLRYEMNIMFSDDTIYSIVWIYDDSHLHGDDCNH